MSYSTFRNKHNIEVHFTIAMERDSFFFHITSAVDALALRTDSDINIIYYRKAFLLTATHISVKITTYRISYLMYRELGPSDAMVTLMSLA